MRITGGYGSRYPGGYKITDKNKTNQNRANQKNEREILPSENAEGRQQSETSAVISTDIDIAKTRGAAEQNKNKKDKEEMAREKLQIWYNQYQTLLEQAENSKKQAEAMGNAIKVRMNCLLIASRIMCGDEVPKADYQYLAKNDPEMLAKALMMRIEKENPKKHKRVSEDEEESGGAERSNGSSPSGIAKINIEIVSAESAGGEAQIETGPGSEPSTTGSDI